MKAAEQSHPAPGNGLPPPAAEASDEELVQGCARGEAGAFDRLLDRYRRRVRSLVRSQLGDRSSWAEDVAQEAFVQMHRKAPSFQGRSSFRTWFYALTLNVCRDHRRRERRGGAWRPVQAEQE